ncbi:lipopolysaccharide transport periplasmic protein LptA [Thiomicrorhabdus lithotrophica]|uniref:Lipopolysaccharide export system protein LptA n=1 Tax=Thiomicrorhabdus lithotrophica TaxID=2949997 RepID=A0ABY8CB28_9GAMM|nr:lipopolysaccharide transport periplasmic protein LptA [Thiomicrorhabdus lithotrophica]WEJ63190.1 lipopolysaccharide transport periplasmic protein LptA [Thiomicrorhabdus lithotrophica]
MQKVNRFIPTLLLSLIFVSGANAATESKSTPSKPDEQQPVNISANSLKASEKEGKSLYSGNVIVTQGSLTLKGDVINISHPNNQVTEVIATGKQASFKRFSQIDQAWLKGKANKIEYHAQNRTVLLIGNAQVEQPGKHIIKGPRLFYDIANQTLQAQSTETEKKRISVTFTPAPANK